MKWLFRFSLVLVALYAAIILLVYVKQRDMLYFPPEGYLEPIETAATEMQVIDYTNSQVSVKAWYHRPKSENNKLVMFFHGNGSAVYSNTDIYNDLIAAGHGVWAVGYPGYPGSKGKPSQETIVIAAKRQYEMLLMTTNTKPNQVVLFGTSLGAGVAAQLAKDVNPAMIIMDAPFNSAVDMAKGMMPLLPVGLLMKDSYRSDKALEGVNVPMVWLHGTNDQIIPIAQGQKLFDGYNGPKSAHIIEGGGHNNLWFLGGREIILDVLASP